MKYAYFPGCSSDSSARMYENSLHKVLNMLGVSMTEIPDWSCCGASSAHVLPHIQAVGLGVRSLVAAQQMGMDLMTGCAACFHRLASSAEAMREDPGLAEQVNTIMPVPYVCKTKVLSILEVMVRALEAQPAAPAVSRTLQHIKPVCYYGCLFMRVSDDLEYDSKENPTAMERLLNAAGIESMDWNSKLECCGASATVTRPELGARLVKSIVADARDRGANAIITACPLCQLNLDLSKSDSPDDALPVFFITQILGLAWGLSPEEMEVSRVVAGNKRVSEVLA